MNDLRAYHPKEAAALLGCTPRYVYYLIEKKELKAFKLGKKRYRIRAEEIERWQREREADHTNETASSSVNEAPNGSSTPVASAITAAVNG